MFVCIHKRKPKIIIAAKKTERKEDRKKGKKMYL
jgi:hypothetical protein